MLLNIGFHAQIGRSQERIGPLPREETAHRHLPGRLVFCHHGEHEHQRTVRQIGVHTVIEEPAHRGIGVPHDLFHVGDRAEEVRFVDDVRAADTDHDVLGVVGESDHFVRDHLPDRKDQIIGFEQDLVDLDLDFIIQFPAGKFLEEIG